MCVRARARESAVWACAFPIRICVSLLMRFISFLVPSPLLALVSPTTRLLSIPSSSSLLSRRGHGRSASHHALHMTGACRDQPCARGFAALSPAHPSPYCCDALSRDFVCVSACVCGSVCLCASHASRLMMIAHSLTPFLLPIPLPHSFSPSSTALSSPLSPPSQMHCHISPSSQTAGGPCQTL